MFTFNLILKLKTIFLLRDNYNVLTLIIIAIFFATLLILGIRKSYILKKENKRLNEFSELTSLGEEKGYKDFTEGHIYNKK